MKLIDTNIFLYAFGSAHPYKEPSRRVLSLIYQQHISTTIDAEVLQELLHVYRRRGIVAAGVQVVRALLQLYGDLIAIDRRIVERAKDVLLAHPHLQARDAIHAAVAMEHGLEGIISTDKGFDSVPGITRFDPGSF